MTRTVAILAGGLGTRVDSVTDGKVPKALLPVADVPFLDHKLAEAERLGADRIVLLLGHGAEQIEHHVARRERTSVELVAVRDGPRRLGTGGALKRAATELGEQAWVTYGDSLLDVDLADAEADAARKQCDAAMTVLHNSDRWQTSNVSVHHGLVSAYEKSAPRGSMEYIDYGYLYLPVAALSAIENEEFDLAIVVAQLIRAQRLAAYETRARFHDIGTPDALRETDMWLRTRATDSK